MRRPARIGILLCLGLSVLLMLASRPEFGGRIDGPAKSGDNGSLAPEQVSVSPPAVVASSPEAAPPAVPALAETAPPADPTAAPASAETGWQGVPAAVTADKARAPLPLPAEQITALLTRGDAFVRTRDIASARLFYERAADAGNGRAALRMGESFDRAFLDSIGIYRMIGDRQLALSWYRRARDLGDTEAAQVLHKLEQR